METIFNLAPIICVLMTFLSLANVAAAIASDNRKYAKISGKTDPATDVIAVRKRLHGHCARIRAEHHDALDERLTAYL